MATKLPPPPTHMNPGSPAFTEWFRTLANYIDRLAGRPNYAASNVTHPGSYCCIPTIESNLCQIVVQERKGDIITVVMALGSWQLGEPGGDYDFYVKLKRNKKIIKTVRGGFGRSGWDGDDRSVHYVHYHYPDNDADATWAMSVVLDDITGTAYPTIDGASLVIQVR